MLNAFQVNIAGTKTITVNFGQIYHTVITSPRYEYVYV